MKRITKIRKAVCTIANRLHKQGLSLSDAFKKAWHRAKETTFRTAGVTFGNRQNIIETLARFDTSDLVAGFRRDRNNQRDKNAIQVLVMIKSLRKYAVVGYVPAVIAEQLAPVMDKGIEVQATLKQIMGGYGYKENYGVLIGAEI